MSPFREDLLVFEIFVMNHLLLDECVSKIDALLRVGSLLVRQCRFSMLEYKCMSCFGWFATQPKKLDGAGNMGSTYWSYRQYDSPRYS